MVTVEVTPNLKAKAECGCGCLKFGTLRVKPWPSNGVTCVRVGCNCKQCTSSKSKRGGQRDQQVKGAKALGMKGGRNHEQHDRAPFRWENKKTKITGVSGPVHNAFDKVEKVDNDLRPIGDNRPFIARFAIEGRKHGLIVMRDDILDESLYALCLQRKVTVP
jgi:hypothetical protein